jgi:hypothetical protein
VWVSTCATFDTWTGTNTLDVNGRPSTSALASLLCPDQLSINGNLPSQNSQWSAFGVAEFLVWNRAITETELSEVQSHMSLKYGLTLNTPPAPPVPAAPVRAPVMAQSLSNGLMAWCAAALAALQRVFFSGR